MHKPGFIALAVKRTGAYATTGGHADHHISGLSPAVVDLGEVVHDLVKPLGNKVGKLHLHHALEAFQRQSQRCTDDGTFAKRRIAYPLFSKLLHESFRYFKGASVFSNVLSHQDEV